MDREGLVSIELLGAHGRTDSFIDLHGDHMEQSLVLKVEPQIPSVGLSTEAKQP